MYLNTSIRIKSEWERTHSHLTVHFLFQQNPAQLPIKAGDRQKGCASHENRKKERVRGNRQGRAKMNRVRLLLTVRSCYFAYPSSYSALGFDYLYYYPRASLPPVYSVLCVFFADN